MRRFRWSVILVAMLAIACGDEEPPQEQNQQENHSEDNQNQQQEPPDDPEQLCDAACAAIYDEDGCDTLFVYDEGGAMPQATCVEECLQQDLFRGGQWCVATEAQCTEDPWEMVEHCLPDDYHHPHCSDLGLWPRKWEQLEERAVELINEARRDGVDCGGDALGPVHELQMHDGLLCAARLHSISMVDDGFVSTTHPESGESTEDRISAVGYSVGASTGIVVSGELTAEQLVQGWLADAEDCTILMSDEFDHIGIGRYEFERWTLKLAAEDGE